MPLFAHNDFVTTLWISFTWINRHQLIFSVDPPAVFLVLSGFYYFMMPFISPTFLNFIISGTAFTPPTLLQTFSLLQPGINSVLFIGKIPFLIFDVTSAFFILHLFNDANKAFTTFKIWILNPVSIFVSYIFGQYDIFPVFFMILALYFLKNNRFGLSMFSLGIASIFKLVGIALIPLITIYFWKSRKEKSLAKKIMGTSRILVSGLLPLFLIPIALLCVPQYYESCNVALPRGDLFNGFFGNTYYNQGEVVQPFYSGISRFLLDRSISFRILLDTNIIYFVPLVYALVLLGAIYEKHFSFEKVYSYFVVFLLLYYAFSLFLPQWFLWVQPFLIMLAVENPRIFRKLYLMFMMLYFLYTWQWDSGLTTNLIMPVVPQAMFWPGPITLMNNAGLPAYQIISIFRTIFSAVCIFTVFCIIKTSLWSVEHK
jgi:hypothetical protein